MTGLFNLIVWDLLFANPFDFHWTKTITWMCGNNPDVSNDNENPSRVLLFSSRKASMDVLLFVEQATLKAQYRHDDIRQYCAAACAIQHHVLLSFLHSNDQIRCLDNVPLGISIDLTINAHTCMFIHNCTITWNTCFLDKETLHLNTYPNCQPKLSTFTKSLSPQPSSHRNWQAAVRLSQHAAAVAGVANSSAQVGLGPRYHAVNVRLIHHTVDSNLADTLPHTRQSSANKRNCDGLV